MGTAAVMVVAPALLVIFVAGDVWGWHTVPRTPVDFHIFWTAGHRYLERHSPYGTSLSEAFVYPPPAALLFTPLAVLPYHVAAALFLLLSLASVVAALRLAGVRDKRLYAAAFLSPAVLTALTIGTITPLLMLSLAAVWRFRNRRGVAVAAAMLIVLKLFLWPVLVWLLVTRRVRAALEAVALTALLTLVSWAWIGFADFRRYPSILEQLVAGEAVRSYAVSRGRLAELLVAGAVVAALWLARGRGERGLLGVAIVGALIASPIVWLHYFALLTVVAAVSSAPFGYWLAPALLWATPTQGTSGEAWRLLVAVGVCALSLSPCWRTLSSSEPSRRLTERLGPPIRRGAGLFLPPT
jgi:hypothetical protein